MGKGYADICVNTRHRKGENRSKDSYLSPLTVMSLMFLMPS